MMSRAIKNGEAVAATDASYKCNRIAGHWITTTKQQNNKQQNTLEHAIYHKNWRDNMIVGAKIITLLELVKVIRKKLSHLKRINQNWFW